MQLRLWKTDFKTASAKLFSRKSLVLVGGAILISLPFVAFAQADSQQPEAEASRSVPPASAAQAATPPPAEPVTPPPSSNNTQVTVNGQSIPVPDNGSVHQTVPTDNGQTTIDISSQNNQSTTGSGASHSSTHVQVNSSSHSTEEVEHDSP